MLKLVRRWWKYMTARLSGRFEESADPKTQLEQAIAEAQDQHRRLTEQAANVIAHQKQTQMRLERSVEEYEKSNASARQALLLADEANRDGKADKAASYTQAAEAFADRIIALEREVADLKQQLQQTTEAAEQAKAAVARAVELALSAEDATALSGLGGDVDDLVGEMESLRTALDEAGQASRGATATGTA